MKKYFKNWTVHLNCSAIEHLLDTNKMDALYVEFLGNIQIMKNAYQWP